MGGDDSQKLLPRSGTSLHSGAQFASGSRQKSTVTKNLRLEYQRRCLSRSGHGSVQSAGSFLQSTRGSLPLSAEVNLCFWFLHHENWLCTRLDRCTGDPSADGCSQARQV